MTSLVALLEAVPGSELPVFRQLGKNRTRLTFFQPNNKSKKSKKSFDKSASFFVGVGGDESASIRPSGRVFIFVAEVDVFFPMPSVTQL